MTERFDLACCLRYLPLCVKMLIGDTLKTKTQRESK